MRSDIVYGIHRASRIADARTSIHEIIHNICNPLNFDGAAVVFCKQCVPLLYGIVKTGPRLPVIVVPRTGVRRGEQKKK